MTEDRNGEPSGSPERRVKPIKRLDRVKGWISCDVGLRSCTEFLSAQADDNAQAYVCVFSNPPGWGVCFVRPDGDFFKYYPNQETAEVAAMVGAS